MTTKPRNGLADRFQRSAQRLEQRGQITRSVMPTPSNGRPIPPGHVRVVVEALRPDGTIWDKNQALASKAGEPYARALVYRCTRPGREGKPGLHVFSYDAAKVR